MIKPEIQFDAALLASCALQNKTRLLAVSFLIFCTSCLVMLAVTPSYESTAVLIGGQPGLEATPAGVKRSADSGTSLAGIAESDEVIRAAIAKVGLDKLVNTAKLQSPSVFARARGRLLRVRDLLVDSHFDLRFIANNAARYVALDVDDARDAISPADAGLAALSRDIKVKPEPASDIIRISFRHKDPALAADFVNAMSEAFIERQAEIFSKGGAVDFFEARSRTFADEYKRASIELKDFMAASGIYSVDDQRQLLLRRQSEIARSLAVNRSQVAENTGQKQALVNQLRRLAPVARSPFVSAVINGLSGEAGNPPPADTGKVDQSSINSPLLLVKLYQDSMAALFKADSDIAGLNKALAEQGTEVDTIGKELVRLADNEGKYITLKSAVELADENRQLYERRSISEKIEAQSRAANITAVKLVQVGTKPTSPAFPNYPMFTALAAIASLGIGFFAAARAGLQQHARGRSDNRHQATEPYSVAG